MVDWTGRTKQDWNNRARFTGDCKEGIMPEKIFYLKKKMGKRKDGEGGERGRKY